MNLKNYLKKAKNQKWALGQFNFSTIEQLKGILNAAEKLKSPLILGTSEGESNFLGIKETIALVEISRVRYQIPIFLNFDHGKNWDLIKEAIDYGYDAVHFDGSGLSLKDNIKQTKKIVEYAHQKGILVEGELGIIKGESKLHKGKAKIKKQELTSPFDVVKFIKQTGIDSLAIAIGNIHGVYKKMPTLDLRRLEEINKNSKSFLVLHGGSGIPDKEIKKAIKLGIVKINFNTELRLIWKNSLKKYLKSAEVFKPYKILSLVQNDIQKRVEEKITLLNSKNRI